MARYIDAELLKKNIRVNLMPNVDIDGTVTVENAERYFLNLIDKTSTADVVEVKHGEWIQEWELDKGLEDNDEIPYIKCSLCGHTEWHIDKEGDTTPNYCSDCGAKMDGGKAE